MQPINIYFHFLGKKIDKKYKNYILQHTLKKMYLGPVITGLLEQIATIHNENMEEQNTKDILYDLEKELDAELEKVFGSNGLKDDKWNNTTLYPLSKSDERNFISDTEEIEDYSFIIEPRCKSSSIKYASSQEGSYFSQESKGIANEREYCEVVEDLVFQSDNNFCDDGQSDDWEGSGYGCVARVTIKKGFYLSIGCFNLLVPLSCLSIYYDDYFHCSCYYTEEAWDEPTRDDDYESISPSDLAIHFYNADRIKSNMAKKYIETDDARDTARNEVICSSVEHFSIYTIYKINN